MTISTLADKWKGTELLRKMKAAIKWSGLTPSVDWVRRSARFEPLRQPTVQEFVARVNRAGGTYHRLDWGNGLVIKGIFDLTKYLDHYHLPADLTGKTALDVGTASGFFANECTRRGAQVTAIDLFDSRRSFFE